MKKTESPHSLYLFDMKTGKKKLAYGQDPEDALDILRIRLTDEEMDIIIPGQHKRIGRHELIKYADQLG